jgi:ribosomal protein S18 acetylase RimI-like enzyme
MVGNRAVRCGTRVCIEGRKLSALRQQAQSLGHLLARARTQQAEAAVLEVRPSHRVARKLYRSMDFRVIGVRKAYYRAARGREDALVMERRL